MKRISVFASVFVLAFVLGLGIVAMAKPIIPQPLPCHPDDIYCTSDPCGGTYGPGGIFYCYPDFVTEYCSGDWKLPVPCSHIM